MEEMALAVALPLAIGSSPCESPMEITCLKLMADTASLLAEDPMEEEGEKKRLEEDVPMEEGGGDGGSDGGSVGSAADDFLVLDSEKGIVSFGGAIEVVAVPVAVEMEVLRGGPAVGSGNGGRSVYLMDYFPLWGTVSIIGHRPEMEDAVVAVPRFFELPMRMVAGDCVLDGLDPSSIRLPTHFFGVYDGHGGPQVADYCRGRIHSVLVEELKISKQGSEGAVGGDLHKQWERAFTDCFQRVDDEVGGEVRRRSISGEDGGNSVCSDLPSDPVAPETVGSTAVVAVICSSHIIVANCGDSRAVLCRGKQPLALSVDHKPNREDEYARIEEAGGKVIQWNGYRVFGVLAMSRSIGDRYLKPWIIPEPEIMIVPRTKEDECLILASDGLWDVVSNEEACDAARRRILVWHKKNGALSSASSSKGEESDPAAQAAAEYLSKLAIQKGSKDNISVIVVDLKAQRKFKSKTSGS